MKKLRLLVLIVALAYGLAGCVLFPPHSTAFNIERITGVDIGKCEIVQNTNTHGGFHGDGETSIIIDCKENKDEIMSQVTKWKPLPLSENLQLIMYGGTKDGVTYGYLLAEEANIPMIESGYYYFIDRQSKAQDKYSDEALFDRYSFNFSLALYDTETDLMYFYEFDT